MQVGGKWEGEVDVGWKLHDLFGCCLLVGGGGEVVRKMERKMLMERTMLMERKL